MTEITLTHGDARATIALLGAEARQWRVAGRDLMWPGDPAIWSDISPILYPVVGWTRDGEERVDGPRLTRSACTASPGSRPSPSNPRGPTSPGLPSATMRARARSIRSPLRSRVEYRLSADALAIAIEVANPGRRARALRLRAASGLPLAARRGGARGRFCPFRSARSGPKFR